MLIIKYTKTNPKHRKLLSYLLFTLLFWGNSILSQAQLNESNWWYFGNYAGLSFSSGSPVAVSDGAMYTNQGCATISDASGNLLFYTNGVSVWNKNHTIMPNGNGLLGNPSSTQSSIIVKKPGSNDIYYIFTVPSAGSGNLCYSEVNMTLQGGNGDVTALKNAPLSGPVTERVTAVKHCNNTDIWVITHLWNSNAFHSYLVTAGGVNAVPVVSNVGTIHSGSSNFIGYLKASPDGSKLACAIRYMNLFELFDLNNNTGVISNPMTSPANYNFTYGIEFSPDAGKLYVSCGVGTNQIWQFNLQGGSAASIFGSATLIGSPTGPSMGALQLASDGKIYAAKYYQNYLGVINSPNTLGAGSNYVDNGVNLAGKQSQLGLPTFVQSLFTPTLSLPTAGNLNNFSDTCFGDLTQFQLSSLVGVQSVAWNFGDPASGASNVSTLLNPTHVFSSPGVYNVTAIVQFVCSPDTVTRIVNILPAPYVQLNDTNICTGSSITLNAANPGASYNWSTGATTQSISVNTSGTYTVTVSNSTCSYVDSATINVGPYLPVNIPDDSLCPGGTIIVDAGLINCTYLWNTGATSQTINVSTPGSYFVTVTDPAGCQGYDTTNIITSPAPIVNLPVIGICPGDSALIDAGNPGSSYLWSTGETTQTIYQNSAGNFSVTVTNGSGCESQANGSASWFPAPVINIPDTIIFCSGSNITLDAGNQGSAYIWSNGHTTQTITTSNAGDYSVTITSLDGCSNDATFHLIENPLPQINVYDTILCAGEFLTFDAGNPGSTYLWSTGTTTQTFTVVIPGNYSITVTDINNCSNTADFDISLLPLPVPKLGEDLFLCEMHPMTLDAGALNNILEYSWNTGETTQTINILGPGEYIVTMTNFCGTTIDDIKIFIDDTCSWSLFIPNAFTPNGDGDNDFFRAYGSSNITDYEMQIFDRWGGLVYKADNIIFGWDGRFEGVFQPDGVYSYIVTFRVRNETAVRSKLGRLLLLR